MNVKAALKAALLLFLFISASVVTIALANTSIAPSCTKTKPASLTPELALVEPTGGDLIDDPVAPG